MKKVMKIVVIAILVIIVVVGITFGFYWYHNMHWYDKYEKALKKADLKEKQVMLPNGNTILC